MLNKMKKLFRNEKGFTLVELLAVIVILGIIVAIAVPAIGNITDGAKDDAAKAQDELVLDAARLADVEGNFSNGMTVTELKEAGYLEDLNLEELDRTSFSADSPVYRKADSGGYTFEESEKAAN